MVRSLRNRFLPMAAPVGVLAAIGVFTFPLRLFTFLTATYPHIADSIEIDSFNQVSQFISYIVPFLILPIWVQIVTEYKYSQKTSAVQYAWLWIEPVIALGVTVNSVAQAWPVVVYNSSELLGAYRPVHFMYMLIVGIVVFVWSILTVRGKNPNSWRSYITFAVFLASPIVLHFLYRTGFTEMPFAFFALIFIVLWAAKESNLLDVVPSAKSGVLHQIDASVFVFNGQKRLVYSNQAARDWLNTYNIKQTKNTKITTADFPASLHADFDFANSESQNLLLTLEAPPAETSELKQPQSSITNGHVDDKEAQNHYSERYLDVTFNTINNPKTQQFLGHILLLQDVSKREWARIELLESNQKLAALDQQKSDFFAGISHEFRTPLTLSIGNLTDTLNGDYGELPSNFAPILSNVKHNNQRLLNFVAQLLELSKLNQGQALYHPECIDLNVLLQEVTSNFESFAHKQNIRIKIEAQVASTELWFDLNALEKVLMNLISNALKSMPSGGNLTIRLLEQNTEIILCVQDTGHGIAEHVLPRIFDAFYYHDNTNNHWPSGTGVGLYLVKQILNAHGADIQVASTSAAGTEFLVNFSLGREHLIDLPHHKQPAHNAGPIYQSEVAAELSDESHHYLDSTLKDSTKETTPPASEKLVLVVEDNVQMRRYIRHHLAKEFRLIEAEDGEEGYALAQHSVPDLILSDLMMPKVSGLELAEKIRQSETTSHIPFILLTAKSDTDLKMASYQHGIDDYITKPFDAAQLVAIIKNRIALRERLKQRFQNQNRDYGSQERSDVGAIDPSFEIALKTEQSFLTRFDDYVLDNIGQPSLRISAIAEYFNMSERSLGRKLNAIVGCSPKSYLMSLRLNRAEMLLKSSKLSVKEIVASTGFSDSAHFSRAFKNRHGLTPSNYREQYSVKQE